MLTGLSPMRSGGWANFSYLKPGNQTMPEAFAAAGYATCLVGKMHLGGNRQFVGFQHRPYGDLTGRAGHQVEPLAEVDDFIGFVRQRWLRNAGVTVVPESMLQEQVIVRETVAFLREQRHANPDQPWFLCASFSRPHWPMTAPRRHFERYWPNNVALPKVGPTGDASDHPIVRRLVARSQSDQLDQETILRTRAGYFGCVDYLDEILGDLLLLLNWDGLLENTIIVYASDHGELAGEHGLWDKYSWHEASVRTPWLVQLPEHRRGDLPPARLQTPVSLADLYPTLCGLVDIPAPADLEGVDLSAAIRTGQEPTRGPVEIVNCMFSEMHHYVLRDGRYKYIRCREGVPDLLFDLETDPFEQTDLLRHGEPKHRAIAARLRQMIDESWDFAAADEQHAHDQAEAKANALPAELQRITPGVNGNFYLMPDRRLVAADTPLYDPVTLTDKPQDVFADWPCPANGQSRPRLTLSRIRPQ
jgi:choline-sulfatase